MNIDVAALLSEIGERLSTHLAARAIGEVVGMQSPQTLRYLHQAKDAGLAKQVLCTRTRCLDVCKAGPIAIVYPEGVWYGGVTVDDVDEIFNEHVLNGRPVERLRLAHMRDD